ncbi:MAG TPA: hypothetical protein VFJ93_08185 [Gaiellaceae bacterium]|nr:hypothetical protein [Gaiellaceae bacterium]
MSSAEAAVGRAGVNRTAVLTAIAVAQVLWFAALAYGMVWLLT